MTGATPQDVRIAYGLVADRDTWQEIAKAAIHRLAAREAEHEILRARYARLLDDYRTLRASTRRAA